MSEIADFIEAQYRRIEEAARAATEGPWTIGSVMDDIGTADVLSNSGNITSAREEPCCSIEDATHIAIHDPAFVLADIQSKRRILYLAERLSALTARHNLFDNDRDAWAEVLKQLAAPFSGEPGYKEKWAV